MDGRKLAGHGRKCKMIIIRKKSALSGGIVGICLIFFFTLLSAEGDESMKSPEAGSLQVREIIGNLLKSTKIAEPEALFKDFTDKQSTTRVIVGLRNPEPARALEDFRDMSVRRLLEQRVHEVGEMVIRVLDSKQVRVINRFRYTAGFSAQVTLQGIEELIDNPDVVSVEKDVVIYPNLAQGIPLMNASMVRNSYSGIGTAIAICDTGIDYTHAILGEGGFPNSKVIGGYDTGDDDPDPMDLDGHGTACAGISAGNLGASGDYIGGVAYNAKLYAIKISHGSGGGAYVSNMIEGWEWSITHQYDDPNNPIMIINTSFGGGRYFGSCDNVSTSMTAAAANAVAAGITLFVSSGNDGYCDSIGWPACISHVVSVGAVYDAALGRNPPSGYVGCIKDGSCVGTPGPPCTEKWYVDEPANADQVTTYSNSASFLHLLAPSNWATTTELGGGYWDTANGFGGTSAACPYAAGAAACLQNAAEAITGSFLTPSQVKSTLIDNGDLITDGKVAITKPRVNLGDAIDSIEGNSTLYVEPAASCGGNTPCYATIQETINAAGSVAIIKIAEGAYAEGLHLSSAKILTLQGGWNSTFTTRVSSTTIVSLTISSGTVTAEYLICQ